AAFRRVLRDSAAETDLDVVWMRAEHEQIDHSCASPRTMERPPPATEYAMIGGAGSADDADVLRWTGHCGGWIEAEGDHLEVACRQRAKRRIEHVAVPPVVVSAADEHVRSVVGDDQ